MYLLRIIMKPVKITFTNNFLNTFDGTQEELDSIVSELKEKFATGQFEEIFDDDCSEVTVDADSEELHFSSNNILH